MRLAETGADVLICGAISRPLELAVQTAGIELISQVCGDIEQVIATFVSGEFHPDDFLMPGCCGRRQQLRAGQRAGRPCRRQGQRQGRGRAKRMNPPKE
jgi:predicted Fe-Mo cluster-binding NifX family protein